MDYTEQIRKNLSNLLGETDFPWLGELYRGKVRDNYSLGNKRIIITTDRQSAFDQVLGSIPCKGQALTQLTCWWFDQTKEIVPNHLISSPDPNAVLCKNVKVFPIEMVIRGYLSGSTSTSAWKAYEKGEREYCGHTLPEGMKKNEPFPKSLITPTTKSDEHDEKISREEIIAQGLVPEEKYKQIEEYTYALFARGQELAKKGGLVLIDTKYEFGEDEAGNIILVDEIHTPDSSRFWKADTYKERIARGEEPENFDKEFLRLWFTERCDPYKDPLPEMPDDFRVEVAQRYIDVYERITGEKFIFPEENILVRIEKNLSVLRQD
ncbi:MAG TPA: phosphoribosylaminoimidazolesuccinocarboxamide synthase [Candidatus Peregrinibacteria bacterium]|nr:phosphoribosylaminoimidazolesuccinocarboxamide synthase [Candidatus Peregrinibacteria bacterium]